jgi:hypothetical protein
MRMRPPTVWAMAARAVSGAWAVALGTGRRAGLAL